MTVVFSKFGFVHVHNKKQYKNAKMVNQFDQTRLLHTYKEYIKIYGLTYMKRLSLLLSVCR